MSVYTYIKKELVLALEQIDCGGTYVLRMEPVWRDATEDEYLATGSWEVLMYEKQVRYWIWGPCIIRGLHFEVMENGDLFTANRTDAIYFVEFLVWHFGEQYYKQNVSHDNDCYWDYGLQQWVDVEERAATSYGDELLDDDGFPVGVQRYCDAQQGDIVDNDYYHQPDVIDYLDSFDCGDGSWDVACLFSDGTVDMIKLYYDPLYVGHDAHVKLWESLQPCNIPF